MQILLPKSAGSLSAEVLEVKSDSEVVLKKEFGGDSGKGTAYLRDRLKELGEDGLTFKWIPHLDQRAMFGHVYDGLKQGDCIVIFPEGAFCWRAFDIRLNFAQVEAMTAPTCFPSKPASR